MPTPTIVHINEEEKTKVAAKIAGEIKQALDLFLLLFNSFVFRVAGLFLRSKCVQRIPETR